MARTIDPSKPLSQADVDYLKATRPLEHLRHLVEVQGVKKGVVWETPSVDSLGNQVVENGDEGTAPPEPTEGSSDEDLLGAPPEL